MRTLALGASRTRYEVRAYFRAGDTVFFTFLFPIVMLAIFGWGMEPPTAPDDDFDPPAPEGGAELEVAAHG